MNRVVVLGASGFVGSGLMRHLAEARIPALGLSSSDVDLLTAEAPGKLRQIGQAADALVMVSAITPDKGKDLATFMKNLRMVEALCALFPNPNLSHLLYVSSDAVYDESHPLIHESSPVNPSTFHGLMHLTRERILQQALIGSGVPFLVVRPCALYGPGDTHLSYGPSRFLQTALTEQRITLFGKGEEKRDPLFIDDLSRLLVVCLTHRTEGLLNAATGRSVSFREVAHQVAGLSHLPVRIEETPRGGPITHRHFDISALVSAFPSFLFTPLAEGLAKSWNRGQAPFPTCSESPGKKEPVPWLS